MSRLLRNTERKETVAKENRKYKDSVFCDLYYLDETAEKNLLELYNGLFNADLQDTSLIRKVRLEDVLFRNMKNDVAFSVGNRRIILSEHQSTINKNLAVRMLMYIAREYEKLMPVRARYSESQYQLMTPSFLVFYNGEEDQPEEQVLRLSDAFTEPCGPNGKLELEVRVVNINTDKKHKLLEKCGTLRQYSEFVEKTRQFAGNKKRLERAVKECIREDILAGYLGRKSEEVVNMLMAEYDYEMDIEVHSQEAEARGEAKGRTEGRTEGLVQQVLKKLKKSCTVAQIAEALEETEDKISRIVGIAQKYAPEYDERKILDEVLASAES